MAKPGDDLERQRLRAAEAAARAQTAALQVQLEDMRRAREQETADSRRHLVDFQEQLRRERQAAEDASRDARQQRDLVARLETERVRAETERQALRTQDRASRRAAAASYGSSVTTFTPPQAFLAGTAATRVTGAPTLADVGISLASGAGSVLWAATRNHSTGGDLGWAAFWTLLGVGLMVEGHGEIHDMGVGMAGGNIGYFALRMAGGTQQPQVLKVAPAPVAAAQRIQVRTRGFLARSDPRLGAA